MRDLITLYKVKDSVNASLNLTASSGATVLTESFYWSSTEYADQFAWRLSMDLGNRGWDGKSLAQNSVRPVVKY